MWVFLGDCLCVCVCGCVCVHFYLPVPIYINLSIYLYVHLSIYLFRIIYSSQLLYLINFEYLQAPLTCRQERPPSDGPRRSLIALNPALPRSWTKRQCWRPSQRSRLRSGEDNELDLTLTDLSRGRLSSVSGSWWKEGVCTRRRSDSNGLDLSGEIGSVGCA